MSGPGEYQEMAASVPPALKAITLTHVRYRSGDKVGLFLAWVSLVPVFISLGGFVSHFLFRRELQCVCFAAGLLVSQFLNELIKHSVAQSRPASCELLETCGSHGWPSSHAQYTFFFATYISLLVLRRSPARRVMAALTWLLAFLTMLSRVYLGYHTVAQVFAGAVVGLVFGAIWYWITNTILVEYFPMIEESAMGRWLYIKDTSHIPDVLKFEYDKVKTVGEALAVYNILNKKNIYRELYKEGGGKASGLIAKGRAPSKENKSRILFKPNALHAEICLKIIEPTI